MPRPPSYGRDVFTQNEDVDFGSNVIKSELSKNSKIYKWLQMAVTTISMSSIIIVFIYRAT